MIKLYIKQAWNLLRQEKLFSSIYILGTGLSITVVMALSIVFYIKIANVYPETNRDRMLVIKGAEEKMKDGYRSSNLSSHVIETCFRSLESAEAVTAVIDGRGSSVQPDGSKGQLPVTVKYIDTEYWKVFPFHFVHGKSFTEADFQSGIRTAVIAESLAKRLFGTADATGKQLSLDFYTYRVCGVVKDASYVTERTYAQLWAPWQVELAEYPDVHLQYSEEANTGEALEANFARILQLIRNYPDVEVLSVSQEGSTPESGSYYGVSYFSMDDSTHTVDGQEIRIDTKEDYFRVFGYTTDNGKTPVSTGDFD
jgi:hypothetical protein